jgi:putative transposase
MPAQIGRDVRSETVAPHHSHGVQGNAYSERFVQTIQNECTDKMIFFGEKHLRYVVSQFVDHYHEERPHQGLGNRRIILPAHDPPTKGRVFCRQRLGGLLKSYYRKAA